jgi:hypothetical protein
LVGFTDSPVPSGEWFWMEVIAEGDHIIVKVKDKLGRVTTADRRDKKHGIRSGHIALQQVGADTEVEFRKIEIKELSAAKSEASTAAKPEAPPATRAAAEEKIFVPLFNGKDLDGWEGLTKYWSVKDGALVGYTPEDTKHNTFLCSKKKYSDFELSFKVRLKDGVGNSGVQIRSAVTDAEKFIVAGPQCDMGADYWGSLYGEGKGWGYMLKQSPGELVKKVVKADDFNDYSIKCVGKHVTIKINGETMVDGDFPAMPDEGIIAWQLHAGPPMEVAFKNIQFTNLSKPRTETSPATRAAHEEGFVPLFNGKNLDGWGVDGGIAEQWSVDGDTIVGRSADAGTRSYLLTDKGYANFVLQFDFKVEDGHHGVAIRAIKGEKMPLSDGHIFDHPLIKLLNPAIPARAAKEPTGTTHWLKSADTFVKPSELLSLPADTWHSMEVVVRGDRCTATVANKRFVNVTLDRGARNREGFVPGLQRAKGKVGFQANTGTVRFRNIAIKELPAESSPSRAADNHPPDAKEAAAKLYEKSCADARTKLLAAFDAELDKLAKQTGSAEKRLKDIEALKEEKQRFENRGLIPWSQSMRRHVDPYLTALKAAQAKLHRAYDPLIGAQLRAKNDSKAAELRADLKYRLDVKVMAKWNHFANGRLHHTVVLYSNMAFDNIDGKTTWSYGKGVLVFAAPAPNGPGGFWIDTLNVSLDGTTYEGTNNDRPERRPKLTGAYVKDD